MLSDVFRDLKQIVFLFLKVIKGILRLSTLENFKNLWSYKNNE